MMAKTPKPNPFATKGGGKTSTSGNKGGKGGGGKGGGGKTS